MSPIGPIAFRTEAGFQVGFGHARRCLSLAVALRRLGIESRFLLTGDRWGLEQVRAQGFDVEEVDPQCDLVNTRDRLQAWGACGVVADSYQFGPDYLIALRDSVPVVVALSDCTDRPLPVTIVVNCGVAAQSTIERRPDTMYLLGPQYALLRPEFAVPPPSRPACNVAHVIVTMGGSDPKGLTGRVMLWTADALREVVMHVIVGPLFENTGLVSEVAARLGPRAAIVQDPPQIHRHMLQADLGICGGGQTLYEFAATGTPAIAIRVADNQTQNLEGMSAAGAVEWIGSADDQDIGERLAHALRALANDPARRLALARRGRELVDGRGSSRVAEQIARLVARVDSSKVLDERA